LKKKLEIVPTQKPSVEEWNKHVPSPKRSGKRKDDRKPEEKDIENKGGADEAIPG